MARRTDKDKETLTPKRLIYWQMNRIAQLSVNMQTYTKENLNQFKNGILILESYLIPKLSDGYYEAKAKILTKAQSASSLKEIFHALRSLLNELIKEIDENNLLYEETIKGLED